MIDATATARKHEASRRTAERFRQIEERADRLSVIVARQDVLLAHVRRLLDQIVSTRSVTAAVEDAAGAIQLLEAERAVIAPRTGDLPQEAPTGVKGRDQGTARHPCPESGIVRVTQ
jgi:hypothetical protein